MPSDSVASFLDLVRTHRLFPQDQVTELMDRTDSLSLAGLCDLLRSRGYLTRYQNDLIRAGRMHDLTFAGYPIIGEGTPTSSGTQYPALHPLLRSPVTLSQFRAEWIGPADNTATFVDRAQAAGPVVHPNLAHLLDAGVSHDVPFAAVESFASSDLHSLVTDIGPMPATLAAEYARQAATGLAAAHAKGLVHGHVRPQCIRVGPLTAMSRPRPDGTPRMRPAATATVKVFELGLVPYRPPLATWAFDPAAEVDGFAYLPPERVDATDPTTAGDVYGLGATLFYLLTGKPPFVGPAGELVTAIRTAPTTPLLSLRPDLPEDLLSLIPAMLSKMPMARPTASQIVDQLTRRGNTTTRAADTSRPSPPADGDITMGVAVDPSLNPIPEVVDTAPNEPPLGPVEMMDTGNEVKGLLAPEEMAPDPAAESAVMPLEVITAEDPPAAIEWVVTPYSGPQGAPTTEYHPPAYQAIPIAEDPAVPTGWPSSGLPTAPGFDLTAESDGPHLHTDSDTPRAKAPRPSHKSSLVMWLGLGAGLQILAIVGWIYLIAQPGCTKSNTPSNKVRR